MKLVTGTDRERMQTNFHEACFKVFFLQFDYTDPKLSHNLDFG